jgi:hypothetical protein
LEAAAAVDVGILPDAVGGPPADVHGAAAASGRIAEALVVRPPAAGGKILLVRGGGSSPRTGY